MNTPESKQGQRRLVSQHDAGRADVVQAMRQEIARLQEENASLRLEQQRPPSMGRAAERARELLSQTAQMLTDTGDEAIDALVQVMVMRETLSSVLQDLRTSITHFERQIVTMIPAPELDRRMTDRRGNTVSLELLEGSAGKRRPRQASGPVNGHSISTERGL